MLVLIRTQKQCGRNYAPGIPSDACPLRSWLALPYAPHTLLLVLLQFHHPDLSAVEA